MLPANPSPALRAALDALYAYVPPEVLSDMEPICKCTQSKREWSGLKLQSINSLMVHGLKANLGMKGWINPTHCASTEVEGT